MKIKLYGYTAVFLPFLLRPYGDNFCNFLFGSLDNEVISKWDQFLEREIADHGEILSRTDSF